MLKLPKGLKKKKKGKKSKHKGEDELFTEAELEQYKKEHLRHEEAAAAAAGEPSAKNEEWSKFQSLTTGVDSVLRKTQGDLDRIKSTSFFQRVPAGVKEVKPPPKEEPKRAVIEVTEADFGRPVAEAEVSDAGSEEDDDDEDDLFDTSYVEAVERGEVRLTYVPDSPDLPPDDDIFDTSHVDAIIRGQDPAKATKGKKGLDIGIAVEVLTGRIDNVARPTTRRTKRVIPGDLLLDDPDRDTSPSLPAVVAEPEPAERSILDIDADNPINTPIDLSVSLHTYFLQQSKANSREDLTNLEGEQTIKATGEHKPEEDELDEFAQLAVESLEASASVIKIDNTEIEIQPVLQESWSAFEADKIEGVFAEGIVEDQIDVFDPYLDQDDPFDTSFAEAVIPTQPRQVPREPAIVEDDDDFDPRAEEFRSKFNNRRKSSVRIHLTDPSGLRESITSDDIHDKEECLISRDLLGGSTTDLSQLGDSPLDPVDINICETDPFDTTLVDKIVAPGRVELKLIEQELIDSTPAPVPIYRVESDPDFDPRAEEIEESERRASRPENLTVGKSVVFNVDGELDTNPKPPKPVTPYYTRELSITEDLGEETESANNKYLLESATSPIASAVLTPAGAPVPPETDPFDTSFAVVAPTRTELKLLAKEFSCEESSPPSEYLLDPTTDEIFQVKALSPATSTATFEVDPFDTSFAGDLQPGRTELRLLESELLN